MTFHHTIFHREPGGDRKDSRPVTILDHYPAFWRDLAILSLVVLQLPFWAAIA